MSPESIKDLAGVLVMVQLCRCNCIWTVVDKAERVGCVRGCRVGCSRSRVYKRIEGGLACEALEGVLKVYTNNKMIAVVVDVDPELVRSVMEEMMDERMQLFIDKLEQYFQ